MNREFVVLERVECADCNGTGARYDGRRCFFCEGEGRKDRRVPLQDALDYLIRDMIEERVNIELTAREEGL